MPEMGGLQTTNEIRKSCPLNNTTPIVALTGLLSSKVKKDCLKNGMVDYLQKPVVRKKLIETVALYTKTRHRRWISANSDTSRNLHSQLPPRTPLLPPQLLHDQNQTWPS